MRLRSPCPRGSAAPKEAMPIWLAPYVKRCRCIPFVSVAAAAAAAAAGVVVVVVVGGGGGGGVVVVVVVVVFA